MLPLFFFPIELGREQSSRTNHSSAWAVLNSIADIYQYAWQAYEHACLFPQEVFHMRMYERTVLSVSTREYSRGHAHTHVHHYSCKMQPSGKCKSKIEYYLSPLVILHYCLLLATSMLIFSTRIRRTVFIDSWLFKKPNMLDFLLSGKLMKFKAAFSPFILTLRKQLLL